MARARSTTLMTPRARTARPVARQATQAVTAAEDFAAPAGAGKEAVVKRWWQPQAALAVQASGGALRVVGIRKKAGQPAYFLRLARAGDAPNAQAINADEADLRDAGQCSQIIMGFVGGFFRTSRGIRVRVVDTAGSGQYVERVHVEAFAGEAGSASLGTTTHALQGFLQDITLAPWDEAAAAAAAGGTGTAAFMGQYPGLQEVLQVAFGDPLPEQGALEEAMSAMAEGQPDGGGSFAERAAALEAQVHTPGGQAGLTRLRDVQAANLLPAAQSPGELGVAVRHLMFDTPGAATAGAAAPAAAAAAPAAGQPRRDPAQDPDDPDDSESELEDEPEVEEPAEAQPGAKRRKGGSAARPVVLDAARRKIDPMTAAPDACMAILTPPGVAKLDAARVLFEPKQLREVAGCEEVPATPQAHQRARLHTRYDLAAQAVLAAAGPEFLAEAAWPQTLDELTVLSEQLAHHLRRATATAPPIAADRPEPVKEGKPAEALSAASRACAVSADVAMRLHTNSAALPQLEASCGGISAAPGRLRADLARAIQSNGKVDAAGSSIRRRKGSTSSSRRPSTRGGRGPRLQAQQQTPRKLPFPRETARLTRRA